MTIASVLTAKARPFSAWVLDGAILAYALWTATCHAVMLLGGNVHQLSVVSGCVGVGAVLGAGVLVLRSWRGRAQRAAAGTGEVAEPGPGTDARSTLILAVLAMIVIGVWVVLAQRSVLWFALVCYLLVAAVLVLRAAPGRFVQAVPARWQEVALWLLALASAFLALYAHRWRNDDCYYVNLAVAMVDQPDAALLSLHTIHAPIAGDAAANRVFVPYRVHSFEALAGLIAHLTGIDAISVLHLGLGTGAALFVPLALARLFGLIDPRRWFWMVLAAMCIQLFDGSAGLGFANQGIVRMFTGKSVLLSVAVPVLARHGIAFGLKPSRMGFLLLLAAQITAVGLSSTALWLAPVVAMLAVSVPLRPNWASLRAVLLGLLSCAYVLALALWVRAHVLPGGGGDDGAVVAVATVESPFEARFGLVHYWLRLIFESPRVIQAYLGLLLLSIPLARTPLARRYLVAFSLGLVLLFANPYLAELVRHNVTGRFTGQRGLWLAPLPAVVAVVFTCLIPDAGGRIRRGLGLSACFAGLFAFFYFVPQHGVFTRANSVALRWPPGLKVPGSAFGLARRLSAELPAGAHVLAPDVVSWYLPTIHRHVYPVLANAKYMSASQKEELRRKKLVTWVTKHDGEFSEKDQKRFTDGLELYRVQAVVLNHRSTKTKGLSQTLKRANFRRVKSGAAGYQLWLRRER